MPKKETAELLKDMGLPVDDIVRQVKWAAGQHTVKDAKGKVVAAPSAEQVAAFADKFIGPEATSRLRAWAVLQIAALAS